MDKKKIFEVSDFGALPDGTSVQKFTFQNKNGVKFEVTDYGATALALICPDRNGKLDDVMLGFSDLDGYVKNRYFGATVGRFANRIAKGKFTLDGQEYQLNTNNGENNLHGGIVAWDVKVWTWKEENGGILFELDSPDGDEFFPGTVKASAHYKLTDDDAVEIVLKATVSDKQTLVNMTNHAYFNLSGQEVNAKITDHVTEIKASNYLPVDASLIPTGEIRPVKDDPPFDFLTPKLIGKDIESVGGYDHNYCLDKDNGKKDSLCATVYHESSGRQLEVYTSQPGVQFYTGNGLNMVGKNDNKYERYSGFALEPQYYPDNINQENFQSSILKPGEKYEQTITWKLSTK